MNSLDSIEENTSLFKFFVKFHLFIILYIVSKPET